MGAVHGLEISHGVPVMLQEDDNVSAGESEPEAGHLGRADQDAILGV